MSNLAKKIAEMGPWYQRINIDGVITTNKKISTMGLWKSVRKMLPESLEGMRVLDLGCNAGHYSVQAALLGADEVIGIDLSKVWYPQALFVKEHFESKHGPLNIKYINKNISDVKLEELGHFDYVFALAILYHIGKHQYGKYTPKALKEQRRVIGVLTRIADNIIVRSRNAKWNNPKYYTKIFNKFGFEQKILIGNKSNRRLMLYGAP